MDNKMTCVKQLSFCAAHRLLKHEGACANLHGHNYILEVEAESMSDELDSVGRVVDFSIIKKVFKGWIDTFWDHATIVHCEDNALIDFLKSENQRIFTMPCNPTAENMARYLMAIAEVKDSFIAAKVKIKSVKVWETPTSFAVAASKEK